MGKPPIEVRVRYFAMIRELLGRGEETRTVEAGSSVGALLDAIVAEHPRLAGAKRTTMLMVNRQYAEPERVLAEGDEVALIPPVSGGEPSRFRVQPDPIDQGTVEALVAHPAAGAVVTFVGVVRDHARGRAVRWLDYEAYPEAAEAMLARIGQEISERWGIDHVAITHRTGALQVGEASIVIAVASQHRQAAFAACQHAIERVKEIVPIWKKEHYADGAVWIGSEADYQREIRSETTSG